MTDTVTNTTKILTLGVKNSALVTTMPSALALLGETQIDCLDSFFLSIVFQDLETLTFFRFQQGLINLA